MTSVRGGQHRIPELRKQQTDHLRSWWRQLNGTKKQPDNTDWILKSHKDIVSKIIEKTDKPYSANSKKSFYSSLAKIILLLNKNDLTNPLYLKYSNLSTEIGKQVQTSMDDQRLNEKQERAWKSFDEVESLVKENYKNMFDGSIPDMYKGLISSLYWFIPPVRVDYGDVKFVKKIKKDTKNYIVKENGVYVVYLRDYKMFWKMGEGKIFFTKDLTELVDESLSFLPRKYLLTPADDVNKPLGKNQLQKSITNIFGFGVDILRKVFGSHFFKKWGGNKLRMKKLAEQMLHDAKTFYDNYLKFVEGDQGYFSGDDAPESSRMAEARATASVPTKEVSTQTTKGKEISTQTDKERLLGDRPFTPVEYSREYKKAHPDKARADAKKYFDTHRTDVLRSKLLRNLNRGMTSTPTQASITKYKLKKTSSGEWV